jgi:dihydropteroate synthase
MRKVMLNKFTLLSLLFVFAAILLPSNLFSQHASAVTASDWRAGKIIDDAVFYNKNSMSPQQIQQFFDAKVPTCDRWRASSNPTYQPPWTCLKEYQENTATRENNVGRFNANGTPYQVPGGKLASQIVWDVAQEYGINPQVLIVMLQKEQGLVTDNWPWAVQYQKAMGYACPDTAPCNEQYYGFYNQVSSAAWQMKRYIAYPNSYNFKAGVTRNILWSPNASCGASPVYIENAATAALYNYTPYQPNGAALNNMYGTGDGCSAYGNRNFWRYFNDWFGSTIDPFSDPNIVISSSLSINPGSFAAGQMYNASFSIKNNADYPINIGSPMVVVRGPQGQNRDMPADTNVTIPAKGTYTYNKNWFTSDSGRHYFWIVTYKPGIGFSYDFPVGENSSISKSTNLNVLPSTVISSSLSINPGSFAAGQMYNASFSIKNNADYPINIGSPMVVVRGPQGQNRDMPADTNVTIPAKGTYTYNKNWFTSDSGRHYFWIVTYKPGIGFSYDFPVGENSSISKSTNLNVLPSTVISSSLSINPGSFAAGQMYNASFSIKNNADYPINIGSPMVVVRGPQGQNRDMPADTNVTIPAKGTYTYNKNWFTSDSGRHYFWIVTYKPGIGFSYDFPVGENSSISKSTNLNVLPSD